MLPNSKNMQKVSLLMTNISSHNSGTHSLLYSDRYVSKQLLIQFHDYTNWSTSSYLVQVFPGTLSSLLLFLQFAPQLLNLILMLLQLILLSCAVVQECSSTRVHPSYQLHEYHRLNHSHFESTFNIPLTQFSYVVH